jgi:hypothetical protein
MGMGVELNPLVPWQPAHAFASMLGGAAEKAAELAKSPPKKNKVKGRTVLITETSSFGWIGLAAGLHAGRE